MSQTPALLFIPFLLSFFNALCTATNFAVCQRQVQEALASGTISLTDPSGPVYQGHIFGFHNDRAPRPLVLTQAGCKKWCGTRPELNSVIDAFQILTTWVLPSVALFSQLPYESLKFHDLRNVEAFFNWIGSPATSLTTTLWNIRMIQRSRLLSQMPHSAEMRNAVKDTLYISSCVNQYEYPRRGHVDIRRDLALLRGILFPYFRSGEIDKFKMAGLRVLAQNLAFQLRVQRRRGLWPLTFSIFWFILSLIFSVDVAFDTELGDNSTAHSQALSLLLAWLPVLVMATFVDRNPNSSARCGMLIERWLNEVDSIFSRSQLHEHGVERPFYIGEFVGQGRKMRYCAVTYNVLQNIENPSQRHLRLPSEATAEQFTESLPRRPLSWFVIWFISFFILSSSFATAFAMTYLTPTIGLGCRTFSHIIWFIPSMIPWILLGIFQEPPPLVRAVAYVTNVFSTLTLIAIMLIQTVNGFNSCFCKSSVFDKGNLQEGYMDFQDAAFYREAFDVGRTWTTTTALGLASCIVALSWLVWRYLHDKRLWRVLEEDKMPVLEGISMDWLT